MALFDFPRIHFSGHIDINVPTMNNAYYFPLALYDQTRSVAFLPPRLYFSTKEIAQNVKSTLSDVPILSDDLNNYYYIEIAPINTIPLLRTWCMTPLGHPASPDAAYLPYYEAANGDLATQEGCNPITGNCPGYWNMYGDMSVSMSGVNVTVVQTFDGTKVNTWTADNPNIPASINPLLQAGFDLDTVAGNGATSACMVETISSQSIYASVFSNTVNLFDKTSGQCYFSGGPLRFGALIYSAFRVVNWQPPMSGSARFCSALSLDELSKPEKMALIRFFNSHKGYDDRPLKGVFVTFTIHEVFENRFDQTFYWQNGPKANPVKATTVGSLTPWYEGDMHTNVAGRHLTSFQEGVKPIYTHVNMTPVIASLKELGTGKAVFSVDMGNSWPELIYVSPTIVPPAQPVRREDACFETADLGLLVFRCSNDPSVTIATIPINPKDNSRESVFTKGGLFDFVLTDPALIEALKNNPIAAYLQPAPNTEGRLVLQESDYMICTDQKGLYAEAGNKPCAGYRVNTSQNEPLVIRIFQKGQPVTTPVTLTVCEFAVPEAGNDPQGKYTKEKTIELTDNQSVDLAVFQSPLSYSAVYYFTYPNQYAGKPVPDFQPPNANYTVMDTGSFVCLKVHPARDYSQYLDPKHDAYTPPDFDVIYREIFQLYDVNYPVMAARHPFTAEAWENPLMATLVGKYTSPGFWNQMEYMPRSRELSDGQYKLIQAWVNTITQQNQPNDLQNEPE